MKRGIILGRPAASLTLWAACAAAVASLPRQSFPLVWLAAFTAPAIGLYILRSCTKFRLQTVMAVATLLHVATIAIASSIDGSISRETALGCSLLPPLTFLAARRRREDVSWALFLAFCTFLIAMILGDPSRALVWTFIGAGTATLLLETSARSATAPLQGPRRSWVGGVGPRRLAIVDASSTLLITLVTCALCTHALSWLNGDWSGFGGLSSGSGGSATSAARTPGDQTEIGLSDRFEFGDPMSRLASLNSDRLLTVRGVGRPLPHELYLRTMQFELAGLDRWTRAQASDVEPISGKAIRHLGLRQPELRTKTVEIATERNAESYMFLPPGTLQVEGIDLAVGNTRREYFARRRPDPITYRATYQDRRPLAVDAKIDHTFDNLAGLPSAFGPHIDVFRRVLVRSKVNRDDSVIKIIEAVSDTLQDECAYALREPGGDFEHSILNFLEGDRTGFCMHFSSALAITLRLAGIPSRIGVGLYASIDPTEVFDSVVVGSRQAHAWVEVPFEGLGWVVFDPTPPSFGGNFDAAEANTAALQAAEDDDGGDAAQTSGVDMRSLLTILAAFSALALLVLLRRGLARPSEKRTKPSVDPEAASSFRTLTRTLAKVEPRGGDMTLQQYASRLSERSGFPTRAVDSAFDAYQEVRFGGRSFDDQRRSRVHDALDAARRYLKNRDSATLSS